LSREQLHARMISPSISVTTYTPASSK